MTTQNKTSEIEYCEVCGTMIVAGVCRRCNPEQVRTNKAGRVTKIYSERSNSVIRNGTSNSDVMLTHEDGVSQLISILNNRKISTVRCDGRGIDLELDNGKTILVRAMSKEGRLAVGVSDLNDIKSDFVIVVSNLNYDTPKIYVVPTEDIKYLAVNNPRRSTNVDDYFVDRSKYALHRNNYTILTE